MIAIQKLTTAHLTLNTYGLPPLELPDKITELPDETFRNYIDSIQRLQRAEIIEILPETETIDELSSGPLLTETDSAALTESIPDADLDEKPASDAKAINSTESVKVVKVAEAPKRVARVSKA